MEKSDSQQVFKCPTCEQNMNIPVEGASGLPQNHDLGFEVEVAACVQGTSNSDICFYECIDGRNGTHCHLMCTICPEHHKCSRKLFKHMHWSVCCGILPSLNIDPTDA